MNMDADRAKPQPLSQDPVWQAALDWHMRLQQSPADSELAARCAAWRTCDEAHARAWQRLQRVWQLTGELPPMQAPVPSTRPRRWRRTALTALAACLLLAAVQLMPLLRGELRSPSGETRELTLADGSRVTLDADSALRSDFQATRRDVYLLRGRAYFQVTKDKARPFVVHAGDSRVRVTGTAFDVDWSPRRLQVSVEHGSVEVSDPRLEPRANLAPGDRLRLDYASQGTERMTLPVAQMGAWRHGLLVAKDTPLRELLDVLQRSQGGLLLLRDETLGAQRVTGVFNLAEPERALQALLTPYGGRVTHLGPWLTLVSRDG